MFDAVLLLALPGLLVWAAVGALSGQTRASVLHFNPVLVLAVIACAAAGAVRSAMQLVAMDTYATRGDRASLMRAARIDPGSYRLHLRLARLGRREQRCEHARAARALYPEARAAVEASRGCGDE